MTDYSQEENAIAAIAIFKMKVQQTMERIEEEHLQNTCGAEIIFEEDAYEEDEEIKMDNLEQAPPKFEDTQPQVHDPMEEVNLDTMEESRITYISSLLLSDFKEGIIATLREFKRITKAWWNISCLSSRNFTPFSNHPKECLRR